ncbi:MAG TPA: adenylate/guanylate cyclase domain-containing protein [bacterium]|nr:adenylate/guanylate cyclase domain-containing protein [Myxococcales bacterium]HPW44866.1 adenylate/guanylate cyclase domain-containing protein [bacterium]
MAKIHKTHPLRQIFWAAAIAAVSVILLLSLSKTKLFRITELKTYDLRMSLLRSGRAVPENVVMFYVDEPSLRHMESQGVSWPWPRELYSMALDFCKRGGARAAVFDIFFSEDSVYGVEDDEAFTFGIKSGPPSYFVLFLSKNKAEITPVGEIAISKTDIPFQSDLPPWVLKSNSISSLPIPGVAESASGFGNAQVPPDEDGIYRRISLIDAMDSHAIPAISLKVVSDVRGVGNIEWLQRKNIKMDGRNLPLDSDGMMMINYYGGTDTFPNYPLAGIISSAFQVANGDDPQISPEVVKDKIVIFGLAAPGLYDMKPSPISRVYPGPEVHATVIENLMRGDFMRPFRAHADFVVVFLSAAIASLGLTWIATSWGIAIFIAIVLCSIAGSSFLLFANGIWMPVVTPFLAASFSSFAMILKNYLTEGRRRREIKSAFKQYLSPEVVSEISKDPESLRLGGEEKIVTLFFSDIADFTTISESTEPPALVAQLNEYFSSTTRIIQESGGTLDKYIGDAIMAFWGAPLPMDDHAAKAAIAALRIQSLLDKGSPFTTRIGIHTGPAVVGNIGSDIRFNYTAIGDTVNLASRLEGLNKKLGTRIMMSESSFEASKDFLEARRIGAVRVKGRSKPVGIYEPLGAIGESHSLSGDLLSIFSDALLLFEVGRFSEAAALFNKVAGITGDQCSKIYVGICNQYDLNPPEGFDGVINFTTK